ncbi:MAG: DUF6575 domain-containing protein [Acetobacteraceae bacterium]
MWDFVGEEVTWPRIDHLRPVHVLDEYDGPRLFTLRAEGGLLLLAYQCAEDATGERFLLVPAGPDLIDAIERNDIPLRTALLRAGWAWIVDRRRDGGCSPLRRIDPATLPANALPAADVYLSPAEPPFLRLRLIGPALVGHHVPASIVRQALNGAADALRLLVAQAQSQSPAGGRPPEAFRRLYDLPATGFAFGSFSITFASPQSAGQGALDDHAIMEAVGALLRRGLAWASAAEYAAPDAGGEWSSIVEALSKLAPPLRGSVSEVEIGGVLVASGGAPTRLSRTAAERIRAARKLLASARTSRTLEGQVREFDKDKLTFILRDATGGTLGSVSFSEQHYDDVWTAFDTERKVVIIADPLPSGQMLDLVSISFAEPTSPSDHATA